jgi:uncharacterized protein YndB with AHSA1/START domain
MTEDILWRLHLTSPPERVFSFLDTAQGRAAFWAEGAVEADGAIGFRFLDGTIERSPVLLREPPRRFALRYFGAETVFDLEPDGAGGCDLSLAAYGVPAEEWAETHAGWVSVLMALKAAADHGVDLRTHDPGRSWRRRYVNQ